MKHAKHIKHATGFTLVELMVVVAIIAIIAAVAIPQYSSYITRSKFAEAHSKLSQERVRLEQSFMDSRTYSGGAAPWACITTAPSTTDTKYFTMSCASGSATTYTVTATGNASQGLNGIAFTINESNTKATTVTGGSPMATAGYASNATCWLIKVGTC